jgi:GTPase
MKQHCGYAAIIGRPNVGKSTLLNHLIGQKLSITSRKPQTTRHRLLGIKTQDNTQFIYVDTPGLHQRQGHAMNRYLNRAAISSLVGVDVVVWVVEASKWTQEDDHVLSILRDHSSNIPVILAINKVDQLADRELLLPFIAQLQDKYSFSDVFPISALRGINLSELEQKIATYLPESEWHFPEDQLTDRSERFLVAEIVREKLIRRLGEELPYRLTVQVEHFADEEGLAHISALIWVERDSQKAIVIGKQGQLLKQVGTEAREAIVELLGRKVFLQLWVKVRAGWSDDERALRQLGYTDQER